MSLHIAEVDAPRDEPPPHLVDSLPKDEGSDTPFNAAFPFSTYEAPFGFFDLPDGSGPDFSRPRKRKPHGFEGEFNRGALGGGTQSSSKGMGRTAASSNQAETAANMLATMNSLVGMSLAMFGMPMTAAQLADCNEDFKKAATEALLNDPALCRKILSAGANTGKAQLMMAYVGLGASIAPAAFVELKERKAMSDEDS